jgi:hypothetical protein
VFRQNSPSQPWTLDVEGYANGYGTQKTESSGHPWPPPKGNVNDVGGDFHTTKSYVEGNAQKVSLRLQNSGTVQWKYNGTVMPGNVPVTNGRFGFPEPVVPSEEELDEAGTIAIARCGPTNSVADASTFLGELMKDGLPSLIGAQAWKSKANAAKLAGGEFLNVVFGWLPLVAEVTDFSKSAAHAHRVLEQYERDAGRLVRRRYDFPIVKEVSEEDTGAFSPRVAGGATNRFTSGGPFGIGTRRVETIRRKWFSGAFTYAMPSGGNSREGLAEKAQLADKLLGTSLTPEVLWELAPWSWAVDWFSNTQEVIHNLSAYQNHGLVMRYGYMMEHTIVRHTYSYRGPNGICSSLSGHKWIEGQGTTVALMTLVTEHKTRRQANPFGFGLSWDGLSPLQGSILAALGMSRRG